MNDTALSDEISIRGLQLSLQTHAARLRHQASQIHDLTIRLCHIERLMCVHDSPAAGKAYTTPEGWAEKQKAVEAGCAKRDSKDKNVYALLPPPIQYGASPDQAFEAYIKLRRHAEAMAVELESRVLWIERMNKILGHANADGYDELEEAHKYLDNLGIPRLADLQSKLPARHSLRGRIEILNGREPKWRDAKTDPPKADGSYIVYHGAMYVWDYNTTSSQWTELGSPVYAHKGMTHWQELPKPPVATEPL